MKSSLSCLSLLEPAADSVFQEKGQDGRQNREIADFHCGRGPERRPYPYLERGPRLLPVSVQALCPDLESVAPGREVRIVGLLVVPYVHPFLVEAEQSVGVVQVCAYGVVPGRIIEGQQILFVTQDQPVRVERYLAVVYAHSFDFHGNLLVVDGKERVEKEYAAHASEGYSSVGIGGGGVCEEVEHGFFGVLHRNRGKLLHVDEEQVAARRAPQVAKAVGDEGAYGFVGEPVLLPEAEDAVVGRVPAYQPVRYAAYPQPPHPVFCDSYGRDDVHRDAQELAVAGEAVQLVLAHEVDVARRQVLRELEGQRGRKGLPCRAAVRIEQQHAAALQEAYCAACLFEEASAAGDSDCLLPDQPLIFDMVAPYDVVAAENPEPLPPVEEGVADQRAFRELVAYGSQPLVPVFCEYEVDSACGHRYERGVAALMQVQNVFVRPEAFGREAVQVLETQLHGEVYVILRVDEVVAGEQAESVVSVFQLLFGPQML